MEDAERTGRVLMALPGGRLVIDLGLRDGARVGDVFAIFEPGEDVVDPDSGEVIEALERVKGHLIAEHVQPRLTQLAPLPEPTGGASGQVLSAVLAETRVPVPRDLGPGRRGRPKPGDRARRVLRRG